MLVNFKETFCPTQEQREKQFQKMQELFTKARDEKWCCTCKNYIPINEDYPPCVTVYPECKLGGIASNTCNNYIAN